MIEYVIHKGRQVLQTGACLPQHLSAQLTAFPECEITVVQAVQEGACYIDNGQLIPMPERPSPFHRFDYEALAWVDDRSAQQIAAQAALDFAEARQQAIGQVTAWAARERIRHITPVPGQDMIYLAKETEAIRWLTADPVPTDLAGFPLIAAEIGVTAETADQVAQLWVNLGQIWREITARIEAVRLGTIKAIAEATDAEGIAAALAGLPGAR